MVQSANRTTQEFPKPWDLQLVSIEVEDSNEDGIFEPGEYLHIRRVRVRNFGGMPSPACPIPVRLADHSDCFEGVEDADGGVAYLPTSIPANGGEAAMEGSIKVRIKPSRRPIVPGRLYSEKGWLEIRADMPWLERRLPSFDSVRKEVDISYPCRFGEFDHLETVARASVSNIKFKVCHCILRVTHWLTL